MLEPDVLVQSFIRRSITLAPDRFRNYLVDEQGRVNHRRDPYTVLAKHVNAFIEGDPSDRFIIVSGLRGTGKTTLVAQLYDELSTKGIHPSRLLYLSMDEVKGMLGCGLSEIVQGYERFLTMNLESLSPHEKMFLFVDEVHYDPDWPLTLKSIFDRTRNVFILATGSSAVSLNMSTDLARRARTEHVFPLSYGEFNLLKYQVIMPPAIKEGLAAAILRSKDAEEAYIRIGAMNTELLDYMSRTRPMQLNEYLKLGTMPFALVFKEEQPVYDRMTSMLEKVVFQDLGSVGRFDRSTQMKIMNLMTLLATADQIDYAKLSAALGVSKTTLTDIFEALERADLVYKIWPRGSSTAHIRKTPKYKILAPAIRAAILNRIGAWTDTNETYGKLLEDAVAMSLHRLILDGRALGLEYDPGEGGADFVLTLNDRSQLVIEVGYGRKGTEQVRNTSKRGKPKYGIVVSAEELGRRGDVLMVPKEVFLLA